MKKPKYRLVQHKYPNTWSLERRTWLGWCYVKLVVGPDELVKHILDWHENPTILYPRAGDSATSHTQVEP